MLRRKYRKCARVVIFGNDRNTSELYSRVNEGHMNIVRVRVYIQLHGYCKFHPERLVFISETNVKQGYLLLIPLV